VGGKIEFTFAGAARSETFLKFAIEGKDGDTVLLGIGHEQSVTAQGNCAWALQIVRDLETEFAIITKGDHPAEGGIGDEEDILVFGDTDRREELDFAYFAPGMPFFCMAVIEADLI
jgi:hypothetical protein